MHVHVYIDVYICMPVCWCVVCVSVCLSVIEKCPFERNSAKNLHMGVGVKICILVIIFPSSQTNDIFSKHFFYEQKREGYMSMLSAWKRNYGETLPT